MQWCYVPQKSVVASENGREDVAAFDASIPGPTRDLCVFLEQGTEDSHTHHNVLQ
jgi:hypothetical protein